MTSVLIVEDDAVIREDLRQTLKRMGYAVPRTAPSGDDALRAVSESEPDVVLMDINLKGGIDGIRTMSLIQQRMDVPVVYLTSHSDQATLTRVKETSPHGFLIKPYRERELCAAIEIAISRHQSELELKARERSLAATLEQMGDAVIATDELEVVTFMNQVAERLTGWRLDEAKGRRVSEVFRLVEEPDGLGANEPKPSGARTAEGQTSTRLLQKAGSALEVLESVLPIHDSFGKLLGGLIVFRDLTAQRKQEHRLERSERLASVGMLAAGIAHEINNPLAAMLANIAFSIDTLKQVKSIVAPLGTAAGAEPLLDEALDAIVDADRAGERVRRIVHDLKRFVRPDRPQVEPMELSKPIDAAIHLACHHLRHSATVTRVYGPTPLVEASEDRLVQVFLNILVNACEAFLHPNVSRNRIVVTTGTDELGHAIVEFEDNGPGIATDHTQRVFDAFFTTKSRDQGTGLGLSICREILTEIGGTISARTTLGSGATFRVSLPAASGALQERECLRAISVLPRRGRVLVIDDDSAFGRAVERILRADHDVVLMCEPAAAVQRLLDGARFDVILCDMMMPGMSGAQVYESLHTFDQELAKRVVFLTTGALSNHAMEFLKSISNLVVAKPFSPVGLKTLVNGFVK